MNLDNSFSTKDATSSEALQIDVRCRLVLAAKNYYQKYRQHEKEKKLNE